jgi:uncharacterized membrane protein
VRNAHRRETLLLSAIAGGTAALLGAIALERRSLWMDEALDVHWTGLSWSDYLRIAFENEGSQVLYLLLLKPWLALTSTDEWVARTPSVVFAALAAALIVPLAMRLFGSHFVGIGAGLLLATNAFSVAWSQQARQYALAMLFAVVVTYLFVIALESDGWGWWLAYGVVAGVSVYSHFFVALVVVSHVPALFVARRDGTWHRWAVAAGISLALALPAVNFMLYHDTGQVSWIPPVDYAYLKDVLYEVSGESRFALVVAALAVVALGVGAARAGREAWRHVLVASWLLVPLGLALAISYFKPMLVDRYLIVGVPALALATAYAVSRLGRWAGSLALVFVLVVSLAHVSDWYHSLVEQDWRAAVRYVDEQRTPADQLLAYPSFLLAPVDYYEDGPVDTGGTLTASTAWILTVADRAPEIEDLAAQSGYQVADRANFVSVEAWRLDKRS